MAKGERQPTAEAVETVASVPSAGLRTPEQWAAQAYPLVGPRKRPHPSRWQHAAAEALHGWAEHAHHEGAAMQLSAEDYFAALVAASAPDATGNYRPHPGALSRHAPVTRG